MCIAYAIVYAIHSKIHGLTPKPGSQEWEAPRMSVEYPIEVRGLRKSFDGATVLRGVDLTVERGQMYALLGPNGAGKTTAIRILSTLLAPDAGTAVINGYDVDAEQRAVRRSIGLTGQYSAVDTLLTGHENLVMMGRLYHLRGGAARKRAAALSHRLDMSEFVHRPVKTYSGGMRRRLDLAVSLIAEPPVLFLDEPTTGLDPASRTTMWEIIRGLLNEGVTILLTTQYLEEADQLADRVGVLNEGVIVAEGTSDELKGQIGSDRLELAFARPQDLAAAVRALGPRAGWHDEGKGLLTTPVDSPGHLHRTLDQLAQAGVEVERVALTKPTLDDVFHALTAQRQQTASQEVTTP